jgi:hypothetical protein
MSLIPSIIQKIQTPLINSVTAFVYGQLVLPAFDLNDRLTCSGILSCEEIIPCGG